MSEGPTPNPPPEPPPVPATPQQRSPGRRSWCPCARCRSRSLMGPVVLITVGAIFLVGEIYPRLDFGDLWPLILIVIGVIKLLEFSASTEGHRE